MRKSSPKSIWGRKILSHRLKDDRLPLPPDHQILEIFPALFGRHERDLLEHMGGRKPRRHKGQHETGDENIGSGRRILYGAREASAPPAGRAVGPLPYSSERPKMKGLGDDHRGHAQGQPDEKQRQEPADPFLPRDLEDAQGRHEIALSGDEDVGQPINYYFSNFYRVVRTNHIILLQDRSNYVSSDQFLVLL